MKTISARLACLCLATLSALPPLLRAAEEKPAPTKTHVLFMGADLAVQRDKRYHRVEDVDGSELKIRIGKREFFVPTRNRATGLKVEHGLKLAHTSVVLDGLQSGPSYTPLNDPVRKFNAASGAAGGAAAVRDLAYGRMISAEISLAAATNALANTPEGSPSRGAVQAAFEAATAEYSAGGQQAESGNEFVLSEEFNTAAHADRMKLEEAEGNYDAMEVSFKISSPVELDDPHMIVLFKFRERDAKPGDEGMLIHAKSLDPISPKPQYIRVREGGLPRGFKYMDCTVHIYNRGAEVATNVSPKRVELTRAEAQQYLLIEHIGANKGATVPAFAVRGTLPPPLRRQLTPVQLDRVCFVQVGKDGVPGHVFADEGCNLRIDDAAMAAVLREVFFQPALYQGKPADGVARVRLGEL